MQIQTKCQCGAKFAFSEEQVGQAFRCSVCHQVFHVPVPGEKPVMAPAEEYESISSYSPPKRPAPVHRSRSRGGGFGCLVMAFLLFVMLATGGICMVWIAADGTAISIRQSINKIDGVVEMAEGLQQIADSEKIVSEYSKLGFQHVVEFEGGQPDVISDDTLIEIQILDLTSDAKSNLALLAQTATLRGEVKGNVDFFGQTFTLEKDAVVHGDLNLGFAQKVIILGKVDGKLTGGYQSLVGEENVQGGLDPNGGVADFIDIQWDDDLRTEVKKELKEVIKEVKDAVGDVRDAFDDVRDSIK